MGYVEELSKRKAAKTSISLLWVAASLAIGAITLIYFRNESKKIANPLKKTYVKPQIFEQAEETYH